MSDRPDPRRNNLLASLPPEEYERILPDLTPVSMNLGETLCEPNTRMRYVYFPVDSIVSLLCVMEDGDSAEIAVVGKHHRWTPMS